MSDFTTHVTTEGERWDNIAQRYYGDVGRIEPILINNPSVPVSAELPGGITLMVPILSASDNNAIPQELLPPWLQS